jgi:hypothetical protein
MCATPAEFAEELLMRRPHLSTGAWIFTGLVCAAVIAPATVYAAAAAKVALTNPSGTIAVGVTAQNQLLTTDTYPSRVVRALKVMNGAGCIGVYTPPAGKAIVVTSVVYNYGTGFEGDEEFSGLVDHCGIGATVYDQIDAVKKYDTIQHTFPTGVPMPSIAVTNGGGDGPAGSVTVFVYGYLIDATALPRAAAAKVGANVKALTAGR